LRLDVKFSLSFEAMRRSGIARPAGAGRVAEKEQSADGKSIASRTVNGQIRNLRDKIRLVSAAPNRRHAADPDAMQNYGSAMCTD
jgi:hypothetical protein